MQEKKSELRNIRQISVTRNMKNVENAQRSFLRIVVLIPRMRNMQSCHYLYLHPFLFPCKSRPSNRLLLRKILELPQMVWLYLLFTAHQDHLVVHLLVVFKIYKVYFIVITYCLFTITMICMYIIYHRFQNI